MICESATDHVLVGISVLLEHAYIMNTPTPHQNSGLIQKSRRNVHAQVVTLERVQQTCAVPFNVSRVVKQQHPRFNGHDSSLLPLQPFEVEVEGMRGVLESCWDIPAPATATTQAPVVQTSSIRQAQLQRLRRNRGERVSVYAASIAAAAAAEQQPKPRSKGDSSRRSSAESAAAVAQHEVLGDRGNGLDDQRTQQLRVLMNLWHMYTTDSGFDARRTFVSSAVQLLPEAPRLLTAEEERALGSIIQQNRKLQQLRQDFPDVAAAAFGEDPTTSSSSTPLFKPQDKRFKWPPALTPSDMKQITQLPAGWRSMLPALAAQARKLLVVFNTGLIKFALKSTSRGQNVPEDDLVASGLAGLQLAAARFDPQMGTRFSTVATAWVGQHINRIGFSEAGKPFRRPLHHIQMVNYVVLHHGSSTLTNIDSRPDVVEEVARVFNTTTVTARDALHDTRSQHNALSLEAIATNSKSNRMGADASTAWSNMLTTADLDEGEGMLGAPGHDASISGGVGTLMAAAGQMPAWVQASMRSQQQQQQDSQQELDVQQDEVLSTAGLFSKYSTPVGPGAGSPEAAAAAAELARLAAAAGSNAPSVTATMLDSVDDSEGLLQHSMRTLLQTLSPVEQRTITLLYGLQDDHAAGLGVELPPPDFIMASSSSSSPTSSSGKRSQRAGSGSSSGSSRAGGSSAGFQGRYQKVGAAVKFNRNAVTLEEVAKRLGMPSHQYVAMVRNMALGKLAAAAQAAAAAITPGPLDPTQPTAAATAAAAPGSGGSSGAYTAGSPLKFIPLLQQFVAEHGRLPEGDEKYRGKLISRYTSRLRTRYWRGKLAPIEQNMLQEAVPIWTWGEPPKKGRPQSAGATAKAPAAAAAAAAGTPAAVAAAAGAQQRSQQRSSTSKAAAILQDIRSKARGKMLLARRLKAAARKGSRFSEAAVSAEADAAAAALGPRHCIRTRKAAASLQPFPRKIGRPRKVAVPAGGSAEATTGTTAQLGRPRKVVAAAAAAGAEQRCDQRNSTPTAAASLQVPRMKAKLGRPRKVVAAAAAPAPAAAGADQGSDQCSSTSNAAASLQGTPKKGKLGKPRKAAVVADTAPMSLSAPAVPAAAAAAAARVEQSSHQPTTTSAAAACVQATDCEVKKPGRPRKAALAAAVQSAAVTAADTVAAPAAAKRGRPGKAGVTA